MKTNLCNLVIKRYIFHFAFLIFFFTNQTSSAQVKSDFCQKLQTIIKEAENGTFTNFKGGRNTDSNRESYISRVFINKNANIYSEEDKGWTFTEFLSFHDEDVQSYYEALSSCLTTPTWVVSKFEKKKQKYIFKNLKSRVFVSIGYPGVMLEVYLQENSTAKCLWGDCINGYGSYLFETDDTYTGDFINGKLNGVGKYTWASSGESYDGYWLNGKMNGQGTYYDKNEKEIKDGYIYENSWINVDTKTTTNFTMGVTDNGFGMVYDNGKYQICNHKDRKPWGMALVNNVNTVFGNYQNGFNGFCIFYYPDGTSYYGNFVNGVMKGKGKKYLSNETSFEGEFDGNNSRGIKFDKNDILIQKEIWTNNVLTVDNTAEALSLSSFGKSLSYLCSVSPEELKGKQTSNDILITYESKYKLYSAIKTEIEVDVHTFLYVKSSTMSAANLTKSSAITQYNALIQKLRNCLGSVWVGSETMNKDSENHINRHYTYSSNMHDFIIVVNCWFNCIHLEIKYVQ